ncbi:TIGR04282 family arsenosugar biosynthesis glycosyltransferase [Coraliomargarita sp. W4R53]
MPAILFFLKAPRKGYVKTRLAQHVGPEHALHVYRTLVERQWTAVSPTSKVEVHFAPHDAIHEMQDWLGASTSYYPQSEGELGARLEHSVQCAFERGARSVTCIGGDCPQLQQSHIEQANRLLETGHDVVFGPSEDGGYYLIALKSPVSELFQDIPWSTGHTLKASLEKAKDLKLKVGLLETLYDIDEITELERAVAANLIQL